MTCVWTGFCRPKKGTVLYSKSPQLRTYFYESQDEIGSYFKGITTNFMVSRFLFEGCLV